MLTVSGESTRRRGHDINIFGSSIRGQSMGGTNSGMRTHANSSKRPQQSHRAQKAVKNGISCQQVVQMEYCCRPCPLRQMRSQGEPMAMSFVWLIGLRAAAIWRGRG